MTDALRVAVACSGLGHVQRGIEAWATDLSRGLHKAGVAVTLFGGAPSDGVIRVPCLRRTSGTNKFLTHLFKHIGGWRYGAGSVYEIEQATFSVALWPRVRSGFDILHVQDPLVGRLFENAYKRGISEPQVVYANGTGEEGRVMRRFRNLQLLTAPAYDEWVGHAPKDQSLFMIPNFVDTTTFRPSDQRSARARFGLPQDKVIVLCCAAIRRFHKRIDQLLAQFAMISRPDVMLVVAGGREADTDELITEGTALLGERVRFLPDVARANMPQLYQAADLFALASLQEMFGIVLIEAMASGLPVVCHDTPHFREIVGPAGSYCDASAPGGLTVGITALLDPGTRSARARLVRQYAEQRFSETVVISDIIDMYRSVLRPRLLESKKVRQPIECRRL